MTINPMIGAAAAALLASSVLAIHRADAVSAPAPASAGVARSGDAAHGKQLFVAVGCYQCHGYSGQGSESTGPALVPLRLDGQGFVAYLRNPRGVMPAFSAKLLPADQAADVLAYIRSLPSGRPATRIPLLAGYVVPEAARAAPAPEPAPAPAGGAQPGAPAPAAAGAALFAANCAACHGSHLEGGVGPDLRHEGAKRSVAEIAALIANPPPGMPKLTPAPLNAAQVRQVATFVQEPH